MNNPIFKAKYDNLKTQLLSLHNRGISYSDEYESIILDGLRDLIEKPNYMETGVSEVTIDDGLSSKDWFFFQQNMLAISQIVDSTLASIGEELNKAITKVLADVTQTNDLLTKQKNRFNIIENETKTKMESVSISKETSIVGNASDKKDGMADTFPCITFRTNRVDVTPTSYTFKVRCPNGSTQPLQLNKKVIGKKDHELFKNGYFLGNAQPSDKYGFADYSSNAIKYVFDKNIDRKLQLEYNIFNQNEVLNEPLQIDFNINMPASNSVYYVTTNTDAEIEVISYNGKVLSYVPTNNFHGTSGKLYVYNGSSGILNLKFATNKTVEFETTRVGINNRYNIQKLNLIESLLLSAAGLYKPLTPAIKRYLSNMTDDVDKYLNDIKRSIMPGIPVSDIKPYYTTTSKYVLTVPEVSIQSVTYSNELVVDFISKEYKLNEYKSIEIQSEDYQPLSFPNSIKYFVSTNKDPNKWYPIRPTNWSINDYNGLIPSRVEFEDKPTSVYIKIELNRDSNSKDVPWVYKYIIRAKHS